MKTVTICGSMRFAQEMRKIAFELESIRGYNVLQCVYDDANREITPLMADNLRKAHLQKINMCDIVYVADINGYIGHSVKNEIEYARNLQKEIVYHSKRDADSNPHP